MVTCSSCGATVEWALFAKSGRAVMLDPGTFRNGNLEAVRRDVSGALVVRVLKRAELELAREAGRYLHRAHFATCPNAAQHRRPKGATP